MHVHVSSMVSFGFAYNTSTCTRAEGKCYYRDILEQKGIMVFPG